MGAGCEQLYVFISVRVLLDPVWPDRVDHVVHGSGRGKPVQCEECDQHVRWLEHFINALNQLQNFVLVIVSLVQNLVQLHYFFAKESGRVFPTKYYTVCLLHISIPFM